MRKVNTVTSTLRLFAPNSSSTNDSTFSTTLQYFVTMGVGVVFGIKGTGTSVQGLVLSILSFGLKLQGFKGLGFRA